MLYLVQTFRACSKSCGKWILLGFPFLSWTPGLPKSLTICMLTVHRIGRQRLELVDV